MDVLMSHFAELYEKFFIITIPIFLVTGFGLAYYGLLFSRAVAWLFGFFWGVLIGAGAGYLLGQEWGALFGAIFLGLLMAGFFLWAAINLPKIIGFLVAYLPVYILVQPEGFGHIIPLTVGFLGGWLGGFIDRTFIIFASALSGAWMLTAATLMTYAKFSDGYHGNIFETFHTYGIFGVTMFNLIMLTGVMNQYGLIQPFRKLGHILMDKTEGSQHLYAFEATEKNAFFSWAFQTHEPQHLAKGYVRIHLCLSLLLALIYLVVGPCMLYLGVAFKALTGAHAIIGWIFFKGILSIVSGGYFGTAFYQVVSYSNNNTIPGWTLPVTFQGGVLLVFLWITCSMTPISQGRFDADVLLVLPIILSLYFQYRLEQPECCPHLKLSV